MPGTIRKRFESDGDAHRQARLSTPDQPPGKRCQYIEHPRCGSANDAQKGVRRATADAGRDHELIQAIQQHQEGRKRPEQDRRSFTTMSYEPQNQHDQDGERHEHQESGEHLDSKERHEMTAEQGQGDRVRADDAAPDTG